MAAPNNAFVYLRLGEDSARDYVELRGKTVSGVEYLVGQKLKHTTDSGSPLEQSTYPAG